jgi:hypothetical protein
MSTTPIGCIPRLYDCIPCGPHRDCEIEDSKRYVKKEEDLGSQSGGGYISKPDGLDRYATVRSIFDPRKINLQTTVKYTQV